MGLPACERRVLSRMEGALRASEPRLAAMYGMFARLNAGEPVGAESLGRVRLPRRSPAVYAIVLVPVVFAVIVVGALLSGSARGTAVCGVGIPAVRGTPLVSRASCPARAARTPGTAGPAAAAEAARGEAVRGETISSSADAACAIRTRRARGELPAASSFGAC